MDELPVYGEPDRPNYKLRRLRAWELAFLVALFSPVWVTTLLVLAAIWGWAFYKEYWRVV